MEEKSSVKFVRYLLGGIVIIICACAIAAGFWGFGSLKSLEKHIIEVKGLSEKIVRADVGTLHITFENEFEEPKEITKEQKKQLIDDLYKKRTEDRTIVMEFLKDHGITKEEIVEESNDIREYNEWVAKDTYRRYMKSTNSIKIRTRAVEKILPIKKEIGDLIGKSIMVSCDYAYKLTDFINIKLEMMREASENARKNAEVFVAPQKTEIDDLIYLRQGEVSINAEDDGSGGGYSSESESINKKLRLVVRAGYSKKKKDK